MNAETWVLIAAAALAAVLVGLALAFQRGERSLRARLVITFVALALVPALTTLAVLLPDLTTRRHLQASEAFRRSMESALVLARVRHTEAQAIADSAVARLRRGQSNLEGLADETYVAVLFTGAPAQSRLLAVHVKRSALPLRFECAAWDRMGADATQLGWRWIVAAVTPAAQVALLDPAHARRGREWRLGGEAEIENLLAWLG